MGINDSGSDYIHLNPARAGLVRERLLDYRWSSFPALVGTPRKRPRWLCAQWVLEQGDRAAGRMALRKGLEQRAQPRGHGTPRPIQHPQPVLGR